VDVRVDQHLVVSLVDRVVQDRVVQADLRVPGLGERPEPGHDVADLGADRDRPDAFLLAALPDCRAALRNNCGAVTS
jgi:hypothetical protein